MYSKMRRGFLNIQMKSGRTQKYFCCRRTGIDVCQKDIGYFSKTGRHDTEINRILSTIKK
ncbi:hypothetical protein ESP47_01460 [Heyndrickxia coagulans]|uniref:Uncharacterized protein n=1 Tax=Heyndrickxia coagulans TaxID=1398 RepID=A0A150JUZ5_HEYCO|nr:hypothetical protein AB434_2417 [Heyndrickxia coagulans]KGT37823.1 hypothetical protein P421_13295 [Heyndrickxia coagulans P38]ATW83738.1 hypothetical protein CIW84_12465 [Heyndrickxia coagulans]KXT21161.1 hypothetical protein UZ35_05715 [Heyndrickxia coagulans]KYC61135.1 hypothetical protein B4098_0283 [Heyndrickxia coagulans]